MCVHHVARVSYRINEISAVCALFVSDMLGIYTCTCRLTDRLVAYLSTATILQGWIDTTDIVGVHIHRAAQALHHSAVVARHGRRGRTIGSLNLCALSKDEPSENLHLQHWAKRASNSSFNDSEFPWKTFNHVSRRLR